MTARTKSQDRKFQCFSMHNYSLITLFYYGIIFWKMFINYSSILSMIPECVKEKQSYEYVMIEAIMWNSRKSANKF